MLDKQAILAFYRQWCQKTQRNGGVLIGSSIRELLEDFTAFILKTINQNYMQQDLEQLASLDAEITRTWNNLLNAHDEVSLGNLSARYNQLVQMRREYVEIVLKSSI